MDLTLTADELEIARKAVEDALIELRDGRVSILNRGNGLVCREKDGTPSSVIRLCTEDAIRLGLRAVAESRDAKANGG